MKKDATKKSIRIKDATWKQAEELAAEKSVSVTKVIEEAIQLMYAQDVVDENIILGRLSIIEQNLRYMKTRDETAYKLINYLIEMIFCRLPDLPNESDAKRIIFEKNAKLMSQIYVSFRKKEQQEDISFMQSVFGDSQEVLEEKYTTQS